MAKETFSLGGSVFYLIYLSALVDFHACTERGKMLLNHCIN